MPTKLPKVAAKTPAKRAKQIQILENKEEALDKKGGKKSIHEKRLEALIFKLGGKKDTDSR